MAGQARPAAAWTPPPSSIRPTNATPPGEDRIAAAKAICRRCPAINECLEHALRVREPYGVWGGLSEDERAYLLGVESLRYPGPDSRGDDHRNRAAHRRPPGSATDTPATDHPPARLDCHDRRTTTILHPSTTTLKGSP